MSIQAQVVNLLEDLQDELDLTYVFIAHDLSVVRHISDRVAVMYLGKIVELGRPRRACTAAPMHPYTARCCRRCRCPTRPARKASASASGSTGDVPSPINPPPACRFHTRCWKAQDICADGGAAAASSCARGHQVACHFPENAPAPAPTTAAATS